MSKQVKLIWEFRGPNAELTAKHHILHLKEYMNLEKIMYSKIDYVILDEFKTYAFIIVSEIHMQKIRTDLKPHKGQYYTK